MDIDAFVAAHRDQWERLAVLARRRRLSGEETDEFVALYRATAGHLAKITAQAPDPQVMADVSALLATARGRLTSRSTQPLSSLRRLILVDAPAALYRVRWWTLGVTLLEVALAALTMLWTLHSPEAMNSLGTPQERETYATSAFSSYYTTYTPVDFAALVWTNNARLAALCVAGGITGVIPLGILLANAISLGQSAAIMAEQGMIGEFFALITPHGLLELCCVFVAGGAGMRLFWTFLVPGRAPRSQALATEGRVLILVAVALGGFLGIAGLIEAIVTPAAIPWAFKCLLGLVALALLWVYTLGCGRRALARGRDGDLEESEAGDLLPVAA